MLSELVRFRNWLHRRSPAASTPRHYAHDLQRFFAWCDKPPDAVTVRDIDAFIQHSQALGHAVATINRRLAALRAFYAFLDLTTDAAPDCPVIPRRHFIHQGGCLPRDLQDEDVARLFAVIDSARDRAMFLLMLRCGLRVSEVHALSAPDLFLDPRRGALPRLWITGKGGQQRVVYLSPQALGVLQAWLAVRPAAADPAVFLSRRGQRLSVRAIQECFARYARLANVAASYHQLRHTFTRHLLEAGMPVTSIQKLLGHRRLRTTQVYLHISDRQLQADYQAAMTLIAQRLALPEGGAA